MFFNAAHRIWPLLLPLTFLISQPLKPRTHISEAGRRVGGVGVAGLGSAGGEKINEPRRKEVWDAIHSAFHQASLPSSLAGG